MKQAILILPLAIGAVVSVAQTTAKPTTAKPATATRTATTATGIKLPPGVYTNKLTAKPGLIYQYDLSNEIASLTTINRELPDSRYFPVLGEHGRLRDGRVYVISSLFDEIPLANAID